MGLRINDSGDVNKDMPLVISQLCYGPGEDAALQAIRTIRWLDGCDPEYPFLPPHEGV